MPTGNERPMRSFIDRRRMARQLRLERILRFVRFASAAVVPALGSFIPNLGLPFVVMLAVFLLGYGFVVSRLWSKVRTTSELEWASRVTLAADITLAGFALFVFARDPGWTVYALGFLVITSGGLRFRSGALLAAGSLSLTYLVITVFRVVELGIPVGAAEVAIQLASFVLAGIVLNQVLPELETMRRRETDLYEPVLSAQEATGEAVVVTEDGRPVYWNKAVEKLTGSDAARLARLGSMAELVVSDDPIDEAADAREPFPGHVLRGDGKRVDVEVSYRRARDEDRERRVWILRDVTARHEAEDALRDRAMHDSLTGLPNRALLDDRMSNALAWAHRHDRQVSLLLIDLDGFKKVNDSLGHRAGDNVLIEVGMRIERALRETDTAARLGGDEFVALLADTPGAGAEQVARKLLEIIGAPIAIGQEPVCVGASIGISVYPAHAADGEGLLLCADAAMYAAKDAGGGWRMFERPRDVTIGEKGLT